MKKPLTYVSLFSSAGVGCFGFKQEGFECIASNEFIERRLKIQQHNEKCKYDSGYILGDISTDDVKKKLLGEITFWKEKHLIDSVDVLIATPPCQGMSVANHKKNNEMTRNSLVVESIKLTTQIEPKFFVYENVRGFLKTICTDIDGEEKTIDDAINTNLSGKYNIYSKILNFKDYGSNSSRTRTLVIGVRKDLVNITPFDLMPNTSEPKKLVELFKGLDKLNVFGEISKTDIYHSFREYDKRMLPWIENLKEGQSAFENSDKHRIPHQIKDGKIVFNESKNGDKYARWYWDREGPCIHTRNDILSSQNTIHPNENRVFSVRELMLMMSIPNSFRWSSENEKVLNAMSVEEKKWFLKKEELNIRHCLGEAVPTEIFKRIASNIKFNLTKSQLTVSDIASIVSEYDLHRTENLVKYIDKNFSKLGIDNILHIAELSNSLKEENSAFFTRKDICFTLIKSLPEFKEKKDIHILEPSVGVGSFLPLLIDYYSSKRTIQIDVVDKDENIITVLKSILKKLKLPEKVKIKFINQDFLLHDFKEKKYDIVVGNPPFKKVTNNQPLLNLYKTNVYNTETNNLFAFFIEKCLSISKCVSLIVPKSLINAPEFNKTRELLNEKNNLVKICDYGEKAFKGVKIETVSFLVDNSRGKSDDVLIESYINNECQKKKKSYLFSERFPYWLIYRDSFFDFVADSLVFGVFESFRDRQITKSHTSSIGIIRVLKARNISNNGILSLENYDSYIDNVNDFVVSKYLNMKNVITVPNLTYNPRAAFLPSNTVADGSVALLTPKSNDFKIKKEDLAYFSSKEFTDFYRVARNFGTRSLNIDNNSVYFFGLKKNNHVLYENRNNKRNVGSSANRVGKKRAVNYASLQD